MVLKKSSPRMAQCPAAVPSATTREPQRKTASCAAKPRMGQPFMVLNISGTKKKKKIHPFTLITWGYHYEGVIKLNISERKERGSGDKRWIRGEAALLPLITEELTVARITALNFIMNWILLTATACFFFFLSLRWRLGVQWCKILAGHNGTIGWKLLCCWQWSWAGRPPSLCFSKSSTAACWGHQCHFDTTCYHGDGTYVRGACV